MDAFTRHRYIVSDTTDKLTELYYQKITYKSGRKLFTFVVVTFVFIFLLFFHSFACLLLGTLHLTTHGSVSNVLCDGGVPWNTRKRRKYTYSVFGEKNRFE